MEVYQTRVVKFVSLGMPKLQQYRIVNNDGSTIYVTDAKLIRLLSDGLQVQHEIIEYSGGGYGTKQPDGNWTGMLGMIFRSEADLVMGGVFITEERYESINFTFPHVLSRITFMTDKPQPLSKNLAIFYPFSYEIWITLFMLFSAIALLFYFLMDRKNSLLNMMLVTIGSIFGQSLNFQMKSNVLRMLTLTWILGVMILINSYKAVLLSFLSIPTLSGIRDISDLSKASTESSFKCITYKGGHLEKHFLESTDDTSRTISECLSRSNFESGDILETFHKAASKKTFIGSAYEMPPYANDYFISKDSFFMTLGSIPFSRMFCCPDHLNTVIHRIVASGLLYKIRGDDDFLSELQRKSFETGVSYTAMKLYLDDISGAFYILLFGWLLSFIALISEILIAKFFVQRD